MSNLRPGVCFSILLFVLVVVCAIGNVHAQFSGGGEDYYIPAYYLYLPPPPVVRKETVGQVVGQRGTNRIARSFRNVAKASRTFRGTVFRNGTHAGDWLDEPSLSLDMSRARVDDDLLVGTGDDTDVALTYSSSIGKDLIVAMVVSQNRYDISGVGSYLQYTDSFDFMLTYYLSEHWSFGGFINHSRVDIEKSPRWDANTLSWMDVADNFERYGAGITLTYDVNLSSSTNLGVLNTLASMNKHTFGDIGDNEDSSWLLMLDLDQALTDSWSINAFATIHHLLDGDDSEADGSYGMLGVDISCRMGKSWVVIAGYETTVGDDDGNEQRWNLSTVLEF